MTKNTGSGNTGDWNTGDRNTGDRNTGNWNTGDRNTNDWNTGDWNTGDRNTGDRNTGNLNTGSKNTNDGNTGDWNTGSGNTGDWNTGDRNTGDRNTGNWNTGNWNTGFFNTTTPETISVFNKECNREVWDAVEKPNFLYFNLTEWVYSSEMTQEEKDAHPTHETCGGYLKVYDYKDAFQKAWAKADEEDRAKLFNLPNFDADVFYEISGIDVRKPSETCEGKIVIIDGVEYELKLASK